MSDGEIEPTRSPAGTDTGPTAIGRRYQCETCKTMVLCLRPAKSVYRCCEQAMQEVRMKKLPSGD